MTPIDILTTLKSRTMFGLLPRLKSLKTWTAWLVVLKAIFGLAMTADELAIFREHTGRNSPPLNGSSETYLIIGRRGGKSFIAAIIACYLAAFVDFKKYATVGETLVILCLAKDKDQARVVFKYIKNILNFIPMLKAKITEARADEIELSTGVVIMVKSSDFGGVRGPTVVAAICDEIGFWSSQGVNPDNEVITALRPAMATVPGAKLIFISTPYAQSGALFEAHRRYYAKDDKRVLVWVAPTTRMNPTISESFVAEEIERDVEAGSSEWLARFREDISACFSLESIEAAVVAGRARLMPIPGKAYKAFTDMAGGRSDAYTMAIGHRVGEKAVIDSLMILPFATSPKTVVKEFSQELKLYGLAQVTGDNYAGEWPVAEFSSKPNLVTYVRAEKPKSELYLGLVPALNSRKVELPDVPQLVTELRRLERRRGKSGKDSVDHPSSGHDDAANSVAGVVHLLLATTEVDMSVAYAGGNRLASSPDSLWASNTDGGLHPIDSVLDRVRADAAMERRMGR
jgi:hypothetical protein